MNLLWLYAGKNDFITIKFESVSNKSLTKLLDTTSSSIYIAKGSFQILLISLCSERKLDGLLNKKRCGFSIGSGKYKQIFLLAS